MVRAPSAVVGRARRDGVVAEDRAEGEEPPGAVGRQGAVEAGEGLEDGRVEVDDRPAPGQVMQGPLGQRVAGGQLGGRAAGDVVGEQVVGRDQPADRVARVGRRRRTAPPCRPSARSRAVWNRTRASRGSATAASQTANFAAGSRIRQRPWAKANACEPAGEQLDLLVRAQDQADVPAGAGRPGVRGVGPGAGDLGQVAGPDAAAAQRSMSMISASCPSRSTRKSVRLPSQSRWMLLRLVSSTP